MMTSFIRFDFYKMFLNPIFFKNSLVNINWFYYLTSGDKGIIPFCLYQRHLDAVNVYKNWSFTSIKYLYIKVDL